MKQTIRFLSLTVFASAILSAAPAKTVQLRWNDVATFALNASVRLNLESGMVREGKVLRVEPDSISLTKGSPILRSSVKNLDVIRYEGNARNSGRKIGGALGLAGGIAGAVAIGLNDRATSAGAKTGAAVMAIGGLPVGILVGHWIGKAMDRVEIHVELIP